MINNISVIVNSSVISENQQNGRVFYDALYSNIVLRSILIQTPTGSQQENDKREPKFGTLFTQPSPTPLPKTNMTKYGWM